MLHWFLRHFQQVLFLDDDVLISPYAPDLFSQVPCQKIGAVVEAYHAQGWHTMHARSLCDIYGLGKTLPTSCSASAIKQQRIFNSGVMLLSEAHLPLFEGWEQERLECRILCDQLYLNAMLRKHDVCLEDLGTAFNLPGTQVRKLLVTNKEQRDTAAEALDIRHSPVADACVIHLTVLPAKHYTSHYLLKRAVESDDVLRCAGGAQGSEVRAVAQTMLGQLPAFKYAIQEIWCKGLREGCELIPPVTRSRNLAIAPATQDSVGGGAAASPSVPSRASAAGMPGLNGTANSELPEAALKVFRRAASEAWDQRTVIMLFATADFKDLAINWAQASRLIGIRNFVLVAMDPELGQILQKFTDPPGLLLPRVASGAVKIEKLNVIGERQRFGLRVLEAGFNVLFADLDAIFLKSPAPLLEDGDIIGERIWGRPISVVKKWGAGICTGFYFVRSQSRVIEIFRKTHFLIAEKRKRQPRWQASDQWAINHAVDAQVVEWETGEKMKPISDMHTKFYDNASHVGHTKLIRTKFVVLPHVYVARSCPILKHGASKPPASDKAEMKKWKLWRHLLDTSYVLHCFPPDSMPCPKLKHGEKGCDKSVIMGSAVHIHGEVVFDQRQGLWFMAEGWEAALKEPATADFFEWLGSQHNGLRPGQSGRR